MLASRFFPVSVVAVVFLNLPQRLNADETVSLVQTSRIGQVDDVQITLAAQGSVHADPAEDKNAKPHPLRVTTRLEFVEHVLEIGRDQYVKRSARKPKHAESEIAGEVRPLAVSLRPEITLLIAKRRDDGELIVVCPIANLTRPELEIVQAPGDPLGWTDFLPAKPVKLDEAWNVGPIAAKCLSGYDSLAGETLKAKLVAIDGDHARIELSGEIHGASLGAVGSMKVQGELRFDRRGGRIDQIQIERSETREPGAVEMGLDIKSTLKVVRTPARPDPTFDAASIRTDSAAWELLRYQDPDGKFRFLHDRSWHIYWDDSRQVVLKRLEGGGVKAQCNMFVAPRGAPRDEPDVERFKGDIRRGLGNRFVKFLDEGGWSALPSGNGRMFRIQVGGKTGDTEIIWVYYLVDGDDGGRVVATFTLESATVKDFSDQDLKIMGSLEWIKPVENR